MYNKISFVKRMLPLSSILFIGVLLLTACNGGFNIQGRIQPNDEGGIDIIGGAQPQPTTAPPPPAATGMDQTTLILLIVGGFVLILILIMLVSRRPSGPPPG